jgi:hypothetical protein
MPEPYRFSARRYFAPTAVYTERVSVMLTKRQRKLYEQHGGSDFVREAIDFYALAKRLVPPGPDPAFKPDKPQSPNPDPGWEGTEP